MLTAMAAHVMLNGLANASLRPLAKAAGTSDRMLIYHFGNKEGVIAALLDFLAEAYIGTLDNVLPDGRQLSRAEYLDQLSRHTRGPAFQPYAALWWDIVSGAARGNASYRESAGRVMAKMLAFVESHAPVGDADPAATARFMLTLIEGAQMLDAIGCSDIADLALARAFCAD